MNPGLALMPVVFACLALAFAGMSQSSGGSIHIVCDPGQYRMHKPLPNNSYEEWCVPEATGADLIEAVK